MSLHYNPFGRYVMDKRLVERYYDISSDFNDSLSLIAILLIINKKSELTFPELKTHLNELEFKKDMIDNIEEIALSTESHEMGRLIRLLSPIDQLFVREKPRDIPSIITEGRKKIKTKKKSRAKKVKKQKEWKPPRGSNGKKLAPPSPKRYYTTELIKVTP